MVTWIITIFSFQVFINFARTQTDETDYFDQSASSGKTLSRLSVRRRAQRLRDMWSFDVQFSPLEEEDGDTVLGDREDWQVTFADQVSIKWTFLSPGLRSCVRAQPLWKEVQECWVRVGLGWFPFNQKLRNRRRRYVNFRKISEMRTVQPKVLEIPGKKSNDTQFPGKKISNIWVYLARQFSEIWKFSKCKPEILVKWKTLLDYCFCLIVDFIAIKQNVKPGWFALYLNQSKRTWSCKR